MTTRKVEIHPAHIWTCDDCGRDNYCRGVVFEPSPEDREEFERETGQDFITGNWMSAPLSVYCPACGATFETDSEAR